MAPVAPSKRRSLRTKLAAKSGRESEATRSLPAARPSDPSTASTKRDKRLVKHASFVSRIEKKGAGSGKQKKKADKQRRPGKKLLGGNLEALAAALPDLLADGETEAGLRQMREGRVRHRSLATRPGALRRKERLVRGEVRRFGVSLARLNAVPESQNQSQLARRQQQQTMDVDGASRKDAPEPETEPPPTSTANRWAALRGFISSTMEQNPAFVAKQDAA
ncbi:ribosome biogenesis protein SLX9-domain-containing protein [Hypoxylon sp. FL1284]|nr:ribosome biogenesis protein SLX9-domain-containing protein [Hypoxylon sp. FL1284]